MPAQKRGQELEKKLKQRNKRIKEEIPLSWNSTFVAANMGQDLQNRRNKAFREVYETIQGKLGPG